MQSVPLERIIRSVIVPHEAGSTLLDFLTRRFTYLTATAGSR